MRFSLLHCENRSNRALHDVTAPSKEAAVQQLRQLSNLPLDEDGYYKPPGNLPGQGVSYITALQLDLPPVPNQAPKNATGIFEVWSEGHSITGDRARASFLGSAPGKDFREAVAAVLSLPENRGLRSSYDPSSEPPRIWGCRLFDNEAQARASFG